MAIAISFAGLTTTIGPGTQFTVSGLTGPVPVDDVLQVAVGDLSGPFVLNTFYLCRGTTTVRGHLGFHEQAPNTLVGIKPLAAGTSVSVSIEQFHANGTHVASAGPFGGFVWDPVANTTQLLADYAFGSSSGLLGQIYAAVTRIFPSLP